jgi:hypothetical protein
MGVNQYQTAYATCKALQQAQVSMHSCRRYFVAEGWLGHTFLQPQAAASIQMGDDNAATIMCMGNDHGTSQLLR